jgi:hypothetical protein
MKKKTIKLVNKILKEKFLTEWEFIVEEIAPEIEIDEFDVDEVCLLLQQEKERRNVELWQ